MRHVIHIICLAVLLTIVTGCGGAHRYDTHLVQADSLMWTDADSALTTLTAIDSLTGVSNLAYRDLLMTQARYKCYADITAADDSAITRAMDYYRTHSGEREKLTRAYLYKGAVMEELGHIDSAMFYYKTAEANAGPKDYPNLGQINTRIGFLYNRFYADEQTCYEKYSSAYYHYLHAGNKELQLNSLFNLFMLDGITKQQQHQTHDEVYNRAVSLASELDDNQMLFDLYELRCRQLSRKDSTRKNAKLLAIRCLRDYQQYVNNDLLLDLAYLYAMENKTDSAKYFVEKVDEEYSNGDELRIRVRKYEIKSMIAKLEGNHLTSSQYLVMANAISDSILDNDDKYGLKRIENNFNRLQYKDSLLRISALKWIVFSLSIIAILVMAVVSATYLLRLHRTRAIIKELQDINRTHPDSLIQHLDTKNAAIGHLVSNLVVILKTCINEADSHISVSQLAKQIKETIVDEHDDDFWNALRTYLDKEHNNMVSTIADKPNITKKDLRLIELSCCGFSYLEIAIIMDYAPRYVLNKRKSIAQKLGLDVPLMDYLNDLMAKEAQ